MQPKHRALLLESNRLRRRLEKGWLFVRPGGSHSHSERYNARFLELLAEYERVCEAIRGIEGEPTPTGDYGTELWTQYARGMAGG